MSSDAGPMQELDAARRMTIDVQLARTARKAPDALAMTVAAPAPKVFWA